MPGKARKVSAGLLLYRPAPGAGDGAEPELLLAHPGGPLWARKDDGSWTIPKGEIDPGEDPLRAAEREFAEELGRSAPPGERTEIGRLRQPSGKLIIVFGGSGDFDADDVRSNEFEMEWPPRSGVVRSFPEVDRAAWYPPSAARAKLTRGQAPFVDILLERLGRPGLGQAPAR